MTAFSLHLGTQWSRRFVWRAALDGYRVIVRGRFAVVHPKGYSCRSGAMG